MRRWAVNQVTPETGEASTEKNANIFNVGFGQCHSSMYLRLFMGDFLEAN